MAVIEVEKDDRIDWYSAKSTGCSLPFSLSHPKLHLLPADRAGEAGRKRL